MQVREHVHEHLADTPVDRRLVRQVRWQLAADDSTVPSFHDMEIGSEHAVIRAQREARWCEWKRLSQSTQDAMFALHVVCGRRDGSQWGAAQHILVFAEAEEIRQVGMAATELSQGERSGRVRQVFA